MGANTSKAGGSSSHQHSSQHKIADHVDFGSVLPNGLYPTTVQDYDFRIVRNLILARRLAPFYKGLAEAPEPFVTAAAASTRPVPQASASASTVSTARNETTTTTRPRSASSCSSSITQPPKTERQMRLERLQWLEKALYNDAVECPICFLYYPANINYSRCCDQPICTECFVQMKRGTPTLPATCPFCMQDNFGVVYQPPSWRLDEMTSHPSPSEDTTIVHGAQHSTSGVISQDIRPRRKTISYQSPEVVLVDHVRPDWQQALTAANKAARHSRRNSMSFTAAGGGGLLYPPSNNTRPGRSASSATSSEYSQFLANMRDMDLEEWMVMEAIRRSLAEEEERRRRQQQQQQQEEEGGQAGLPTITVTHDSSSSSSSSSSGSDDDDDDQPLANRLRDIPSSAAEIQSS